MSVYLDQIENDKNLPITCSINIQNLSTTKRPLTCYITATPRTSNRSNYCKPAVGSRENQPRSSIHLPVTYSSSVHVPCHSSTIAPHSTTNLPPQSSHHHHHYHHYHHYYHHHRRQSLPLSPRASTTIKQKISPLPTSIASTRARTTSTTTITPPDSPSPSPSKQPSKKILIPFSPNKRSSHRPSPPPLPSYSTLVRNWFHHTTPTKPSPHHKSNQSDYSETYRHRSPNKRNILFKILTSSMEKQSKSKSHRPCFSRKRLESSSSLPTKSPNHYIE